MDSSTSSSFDQHHHNPLQNELILSKIFSNLLVTPDLLNCRKVCRTWVQNPVISSRIRKDVIIHFNNDYQKLDEFINFLKQWDIDEGELFTKFDITFTSQCHTMCDHQEGEILETGDIVIPPHQDKLLSLFHNLKGPLTYLKLTLDKTHLNKDGLEEILLQNPQVRQNLGTLSIYNLSHRGVFSQQGSFGTLKNPALLLNLRKLVMDEIRIPITPFVTNFLKVCPNLEEIVMKCDKRSDWENQTGIWKEHSPLATSIIQGLLKKSEQDNTLLKLHSLSCGILDISHFTALNEISRKGHLRLRVLEIYCPARDATSEILKEFLTLQGKTLEVLRVLGNVEKLRRAVGGGGESLFALELPDVMPALLELQLSGRDKDTPIPLMRPLNYGIQFPSLNTVIVNGFANNILDKMSDYFNPWISPFSSVKKVIIPAEIRDQEFPSNLARIFPNLEKLDVKYPDSTFLMCVGQHLKKLRRLKVLLEADGVGEDIEDGLRFLIDLKKLQNLDLILETDHMEIPTAFTDKTAYEILFRMKQLRKLVLLSCCWFDGLLPCNFLTEKCQKDLSQELEDCVIIFTPSVTASCLINKQ